MDCTTGSGMNMLYDPVDRGLSRARIMEENCHSRLIVLLVLYKVFTESVLVSTSVVEF